MKMEKFIELLREEIRQIVREELALVQAQKPDASDGDFSVLVRGLRARMQLSQAGFAKFLGRNTISVSHWETGKNIPRRAMREKIRELSELSAKELADLRPADLPRLHERRTPAAEEEA